LELGNGTMSDSVQRHARLQPVGVGHRATARAVSCPAAGSSPEVRMARSAGGGVGMVSEQAPIIEAYSRYAAEYDGEGNSASCWGILSRSLWTALEVSPRHRLVVDVGCGAGDTLAHLAGLYPTSTHLVGIEPAENMRTLGRSRTGGHPNVAIREGAFEALPLKSGSVDYLYSILAFHWVEDADLAAREVGRVLGREGAADIFFVGRWNGREVIERTTPIFLRYMELNQLLAAARLRKQLTAAEAKELFERAVRRRRVQVFDLNETYFDTLDGHWRWWVRIEGQLSRIPPAKRSQCEQDLRGALRQLEGPKGIPYTVHVVHVKIGGQERPGTGARARRSGPGEWSSRTCAEPPRNARERKDCP
jgi:ubiquinone/menaquinone biosynthesis C-methylase UbiE